VNITVVHSAYLPWQIIHPLLFFVHTRGGGEGRKQSLDDYCSFFFFFFFFLGSKKKLVSADKNALYSSLCRDLREVVG
jgi:hypothetical protein